MWQHLANGKALKIDDPQNLSQFGPLVPFFYYAVTCPIWLSLLFSLVHFFPFSFQLKAGLEPMSEQYSSDGESSVPLVLQIWIVSRVTLNKSTWILTISDRPESKLSQNRNQNQNVDTEQCFGRNRNQNRNRTVYRLTTIIIRALIRSSFRN